MENARALEERLKQIIREVSNLTGREIKKDLLAGFEQEITGLIQQNSRQELARTLILFKKTLKEI